MTDDLPASGSRVPSPGAPGVAAPSPDAASSWIPSAFWTWAAIATVAALAVAFGWDRIDDAFDARRLFR